MKYTVKLSEISTSLQHKFPDRHQENWQFTDISFLKALDLQLPAIQSSRQSSSAKSTGNSLHICLRDGQLVSAPQSPFTVQTTVQTIADTAFAIAPSDQDYFTELNCHLNGNTIHIHIPDEYQSITPIFLDHQISTDQLLVQPRIIMHMGKNSQITLIENFNSQANHYLHNCLTLIELATNAQLQHIRLQNEHPSASHIATTIIHQSTNSNYQGIMLDLGAKLSRHKPIIYSAQAGVNSMLSGLAIIDNDRLIDTHSSINHLAPNCTSQQLHKAIISDRGQGVFNGRIYVSKPAQNTDSAQLSRTLLLSPTAKINTKPQLEIIADSVKCKHGATISQLDPEEYFYLQSRGISPSTATQLLTYSFANEVTAGITNQQIRTEMTTKIKNALPSDYTTAPH